MEHIMKKLIFLCLLALLSLNVQADWQLNNKQSLINFVSIKKSSVAEINHFKSLSGKLADGIAKINIDLSSVETNVQIRNERMTSMLFDTSKYLSASISAKIDTSKLDDLKIGQHYQEKLSLTLDLHGVTKDISATVSVIKLSDTSIIVNSQHPVIINAADFKLADAIEALRSIAKLPTISTAVPVTFSLIFSR